MEHTEWGRFGTISKLGRFSLHSEDVDGQLEHLILVEHLRNRSCEADVALFRLRQLSIEFPSRWVGSSTFAAGGTGLAGQLG